MQKIKKTNGFTLAEVLIVVAIIAVLVAIAIPLFTSQMERSREATDLANVRNAYMTVMFAAAESDPDSPLHMDDGSYAMEVPLHQKVNNWTMEENTLNVGGIVPEDENWIGTPIPNGKCSVTYSPDMDMVLINWQANGSISYLQAVKPYQNQTLMNLKNMSNDERSAADKETLNTLGQYVLNLCKANNWSKAQLFANLGIHTQGNSVRLANFYETKDGSYAEGASYSSNGFRIESTTQLLDVLRDMGYNGGTEQSSGNVDLIMDNVHHDGVPYTVYDNSLFYSDELATNKFHNYTIDKTMRSIIIENVHESGGKVTGFTIYAKAMNGEANMNTAEKAKFRVTIGS